MRDWLQGVLQAGRDLPEDAEGYLRGRGMREKLISELEMAIWHCPTEPAPDKAFSDKYGAHGEYLRGKLICPFFSPRGEIIGFEGRTWDGTKRITDYRMAEGSWNPVFIGLTSATMRRLWDGGNAWVVEGLFDLTALERVVPEKDVVLATIRAKLSRSHVEFLRRYVRKARSQTVYMVYDNDETGRKQTHGWTDDLGKDRWGALTLLSRVGVDCQDFPYSGGKDPGEIWDKGGEVALRRTFAPII